MIRQINNLFSVSSLRTDLFGSIKFIGLPKHFHRTLPQIFIFIFLLIFLSFSCSTNEPPPDTGAIILVVEDASCIEAWINLKAENITLPAAVTLKQSENNGEEKVRQVINLTTADTLLYVDSLLPKRSYKFKAEWINNSGKLKTAEASTVTMDTTSHNFTWQTFTFGQHSSSTLYDVAIINENNIWAVGEIYMNDSLGNPDPHAYNAVHWDGNVWELKKIPFEGCGGVLYPPIYSIFAFNTNDIWFTRGGTVLHYNGNTYRNYCELNPLLTGSINKLWGSSSNDLYAVGNGGNIAHWDGISWKKIESGTSLNFYDVWGEYYPDENNYEVCLIAAERLIGPRRKIYTVKNNLMKELSTSNIPIGSISGIWFKTKRKYYIVGNGLFIKNNIEDENNWEPMQGLTPYYIYAISGIAFNDIFLCGSFGETLHYNGMSWMSFKDIPGFFDFEFYNLDFKAKIVAAVGQRYSSASIAFGKIE